MSCDSLIGKAPRKAMGINSGFPSSLTCRFLQKVALGEPPSPFKVNFLLRFFCLENARWNVLWANPTQPSQQAPALQSERDR